jgi:hypothetical protein
MAKVMLPGACVTIAGTGESHPERQPVQGPVGSSAELANYRTVLPT